MSLIDIFALDDDGFSTSSLSNQGEVLGSTAPQAVVTLEHNYCHRTSPLNNAMTSHQVNSPQTSRPRLSTETDDVSTGISPETRTYSHDSFAEDLDHGNSPCSSFNIQEREIPRKRNNEACRKSRRRKKFESAENERRVASLAEENDGLRAEIERMERERDAVKSRLMETIKRGFCT